MAQAYCAMDRPSVRSPLRLDATSALHLLDALRAGVPTRLTPSQAFWRRPVCLGNKTPCVFTDDPAFCLLAQQSERCGFVLQRLTAIYSPPCPLYIARHYFHSTPALVYTLHRGWRPGPWARNTRPFDTMALRAAVVHIRLHLMRYAERCYDTQARLRSMDCHSATVGASHSWMNSC